ncbi:hypothetical protein SRHO_G00011720 [Serrasalmus rhombeus]
MVTRPPGEIFEGRSVTLTCSCDANPPVVSYTWFKRSGIEDSQIWTGQNYTFEHISVGDSYKYKCRASNRLGSAISESMRLDILYGPRRVEVFSRPSGGILEGRSVTLTCSSDANPPVESYTWFKRSGTEDSQIWTGQNYTIEYISVEDSYKYKCRASNRHRSVFSEYTPLDILYGPKRVQVSSKPFGGIMEGGSMTLTCSSEANPSVKSYTWFKRSGEEDLEIGTGQNYAIEHISVEDSYKYKCRASNQHGSAFSEYTPLNILYSPKNTSVTVTLTCKAHANPPVMDYTWYKEGEGESEPVAYGQTYSITSITKEDIEPFYCKTRNSIGHDYARPVPVTCISKAQVAAAGIGGFCGGLATAVLFTILWIRTGFTRAKSQREAGFIVAKEVAQAARPFTEGEFLKSCRIKVCDLVCPDKKQVLANLSLSRNTAADRVCEMATDLRTQLSERSKDFTADSLAVDESPDTTDTAQLAIFIPGVDSNLRVTEEILDIKSMHGTT